jgi:predicted SAM-dependent methyltransferase
MKKKLKNIYNRFPVNIKKYLKNIYELFSSVHFNIQIIVGKLKNIILRKKYPNTNKLQVHLGCGRVNHKSFVNVDGFPYKHVHHVNRIDKLNMFKSETVHTLYASHCLEHFYYNKINEVLKEWYRVLRNNGELYISVPDLDKLVAIYKENMNDPDCIIEQLMGGQNNKYNFHYTVFNKVNLTNALINVGFNDVQEWNAPYNKDGVISDFSIYEKTVNGTSYPISLNLKAVKNV